MVSIEKAGEKDAGLLSGIAKQTFLQSHGHSAPAEDVNNYVAINYSPDILQKELSDPQNQYHIIYHNGIPAGYSKIIFNLPYISSPLQNIAKLERLYLLHAFHNLKLGLQLFQFNIALAKSNDQLGAWLHVWTENPGAIDFYTKNGFYIIGSHSFKISETHSNPNHMMLLRF